MSNYDCAATDEAILWASIEEEELHNALIEAAKIDLLNWAMQVCTTGSTPSMIRKVFHNKIIEIEGKGEKA